jgi:hypothetical protein
MTTPRLVLLALCPPHRWLIEPPTAGETLQGYCRGCGARREFAAVASRARSMAAYQRRGSAAYVRAMAARREGGRAHA